MPVVLNYFGGEGLPMSAVNFVLIKGEIATCLHWGMCFSWCKCQDSFWKWDPSWGGEELL